MKKEPGLFLRFLAADKQEREKYERSRQDRFKLLKELLYDHLPPHLKKLLGEERYENIILFMADHDEPVAEISVFCDNPEEAEKEFGVRDAKELQQRVLELRQIWKRYISVRLITVLPNRRYELRFKAI